MARGDRPPPSPRQRPVRAVYGALGDLPAGTKLEVRCDRALVTLYLRGDLVKVHARKPKGGRSTDANDFPAGRTAYAMRAPDRIVSQDPVLAALGRATAGGTLSLVQIAPGPEAAALGRTLHGGATRRGVRPSVGFDLVDVRRVERILVLALEHEGQPSRPVEERVQLLPAGRFARLGSAFDHRFAVTQETVP